MRRSGPQVRDSESSKRPDWDVRTRVREREKGMAETNYLNFDLMIERLEVALADVDGSVNEPYRDLRSPDQRRFSGLL